MKSETPVVADRGLAEVGGDTKNASNMSKPSYSVKRFCDACYYSKEYFCLVTDQIVLPCSAVCSLFTTLGGGEKCSQ
jgi:hypothetical protein